MGPICLVALTPLGTYPHALLKWLGTGDIMTRIAKTDQTVLAIMKALCKTTNCTRKAIKVEGNDMCPPLLNSFRCHCIGPTGENLRRVLTIFKCCITGAAKSNP